MLQKLLKQVRLPSPGALGTWLGRKSRAAASRIRTFASTPPSFRSFVGVLITLLFFGALFWAKGRDPFQRIWFTVKAAGQPKAECVAVLPKTSLKSKVQSLKSGPGERLPVLIYLHGSGGELMTDGNDLRQMAEMGLACVGMDYDQGSEAASDAQFAALLAWVQRQQWADTNRVAWVGFSLGAQRILSFAWRHPESRPNLLVRLSGGWVPDLEKSKVQSLKSKVGVGVPREIQSKVQSLTSKVQGPNSGMAALLIHGGRDEVFPVSDAERVKGCFESIGVPVELKLFAEEEHGFSGNRLMLERAIGEYCRTRLEGTNALCGYESILAWQARAKPLWLYWVPAMLWAAYGLWARRVSCIQGAGASPSPPLEERVGERRPIPVPTSQLEAPTGGRAGASGVVAENDGLLSLALSSKGGEGTTRQPGSTEVRAGSSSEPPVPLRPWEIALRWVAGVLAVAATGQTALHLLPPRLAVSGRTLSIAGKHLVLPKQQADFEFLAAKPFWRGKRLGTLLEHVELANYNRELINWKLDEEFYRNFVLSPEIDPASDGAMTWRRPLWENFYPRIRKEDSPEAAAEIVARFLRERVTVAEGDNFPLVIAEAWRSQITSPRGFEALYVAALRSVGIPARLGPGARAEFWTGWRGRPRPGRWWGGVGDSKAATIQAGRAPAAFPQAQELGLAGEGGFPRGAGSRGWKAPFTGSLERLPYGGCLVGGFETGRAK